jgi:asparagine synthase (glutamine-hydrolysing)
VSDRTKRPYRAPIGQAFVGPDAPEYVRELLQPERLEEAGLFSPDAVRRVVAKFEAAGGARAGETDEMALVGAVSTMLLHEQLVARPSLAPESVPARIVVGATVERDDARLPVEAAS